MSKYYAQLNENGIVHTVCQLSGEVKQDNVIEVNSLDEKHMGCKWDGKTFRKLKLTSDIYSLTTFNSANLTVQWQDVDGKDITYGEEVTLKCLETGDKENITVTDGVGSTTFESEEVGIFTLEITSPDEVKDRIKVVVE